MGQSGRWYGNEPVNPNLAETVYTFVATNNQSTFGPVLYLPPYIDIFVDGVKLSRQNDIIMGTGSPCATTVDVSASIAESISEGSIVEIVTKVPTKLLDALTQAIADTLYVKKTDIITPPQFDNDVSLATTEFVQRALGNYANFVNYTASQTLTTAQAGGYFRFTISAPAVCELPAPNTVQAGSKFSIQNAGGSTFPLQIQTPSGVISGPGANGVAVSSITLSAGIASQMEFVSDGSGVWYAINGNFSGNFSTNGYQKLPSGLIIQWSRNVAHTQGDYTTAVTFPIAFPNACISAIACQAASVGNSATVMPQVSNSPAASGMDIYWPTGQNVGSVFNYIAIGY